jgi:DNA-nicking Smr family endonuclease
MLFAKGTRVKFLHTGDEGVVSGLLDDGMVMVYLELEDMEIPAFPDDLIRWEAIGKTEVKAKIISGKKEKETAERPAPATAETQYLVLRHSGVHLAFEPVIGKEGLPTGYTIYLLNDSAFDLIYDIRLFRNHKRPEKWEGRSASTTYTQLGTMEYDDLNESPSFDASISWITTEGVAKPEEKALNLKPKTFFAGQKVAPFLNRPVHLFLLIEKPADGQQKKEGAEDLYSYTKRHHRQAPQQPLSSNKHLSKHEIRELAEFPAELDLHIEKLTDNWQKMSNAEILRRQIAAFEAYLDKAVRLGVPRVFVIHGIGEGILKNSIATRLFGNPDVESFRNEYHPNYGWGATEILLK